MALLGSFVVYGTAKPQGSTRTWNKRDPQTGAYKPAITHTNRESLMQWRRDIRAAMQAQAPQLCQTLIDGPLAVRAIFAINKPPSVPKKRAFPIVAPDSDKLCRSLGDALEKVVIRNDSQIVCWQMWKVYTTGPSRLLVELWAPDAFEMPKGNPFAESLPFAHAP